MNEAIIYSLMFISLYFEVYLLVTFLHHSGELKKEDETKPIMTSHFVSVIVPVWNEEKTVVGTINSLLALRHPKHRLEIIIVDDGSTDSTLKVLEQFEDNSQIRVLTKKNGGKHTAVNYGLKYANGDFMGCLDADSFADKNALLHIMDHFNDPEVMAVTPSILISSGPKKLIQRSQRIEYIWGVFMKKMFAYMNALYITPGPLTIFRKEVFSKIGNYRHAYLTEDCEMALRMQDAGMKISNAHNAHIYTVGPDSIRKLIVQRLRWTYGFIKNSVDYKHLFFNKRVGMLGLFVLPTAALSLISLLFLSANVIVSWANALVHKIIEVQTVGWSFTMPKFGEFDLFYINTDIAALISLVLFGMMLVMIVSGRLLVKDRGSYFQDIALFFVFYMVLAPIWIGRSIYNVTFSRTTSWR